MGGTILYLLPSAIQLAGVNFPVCKIENNMGKLVFWSAPPKTDIPVETLISSCYFT